MMPKYRMYISPYCQLIFMSNYGKISLGDIMKINLIEAVNLIKTTVDLNSNPYFFVVGAGISVPEIPLANEIINICKQKVKLRSSVYYEECLEDTKKDESDPMRYYSRWISLAYPNRIDRSNFFKELISKAKISSANLMLAQILSSKKIASTVFTTNFDDKIKAALELIGEKDFFISENAMDNLVITPYSKSVQIVHVHGTYHFYDCANIESEISGIASQSGTISSSTVMKNFLASQAHIIVGYNGWENDVIMSCIRERLNYPTPLSYIWVCYSQTDYDLLPKWLKENDNICFVLPEELTQECKEKDNSHFAFDMEQNDLVKRIDSKNFFSELISNFKLEAPSLFVNPFSYYSKQINDVLPEHEDVLHLKHWAQRMQYFGNNESTFEKLVKDMEEASIHNDFQRAGEILQEIAKEELNSNDLKFVCNSLIRDLLKKENSVVDFEKIILFHIALIDFTKSRKDLSVDNQKEVLKKALFIKTAIKDKDKYLLLIDRVIEATEDPEELVSNHMAALGVKSSYIKDKEQKKKLLELLLSKAPKNSEDRYIKQLKAMALLELCELVNSDAIISTFNNAESILNELNDDYLNIRKFITKSELLRYDFDSDIKRKWINELVGFVKDNLDNDDEFLCINICANLSRMPNDTFDNIEEFENILNWIIDNVDSSTFKACHHVLDYCYICSFVARTTNLNSTKIRCCDLVLKLKDKIPCDCSGYNHVLKLVMIEYCSLPISVLPDEKKIERLGKVKEFLNMDRIYYSILSIAYQIGDKIQYQKEMPEDVDYVEKYNLFTKGLEFYYKKNFNEAEKIFESLFDCGIEYIEEASKINLSFMVRRSETRSNESSFLEIISQINKPSALKNMNIVLYFKEKNDTENCLYKSALEELKGMSSDLLEEVKNCWTDIELVGESENKIAMDILTSIGIKI